MKKTEFIRYLLLIFLTGSILLTPRQAQATASEPEAAENLTISEDLIRPEEPQIPLGQDLLEDGEASDQQDLSEEDTKKFLEDLGKVKVVVGEALKWTFSAEKKLFLYRFSNGAQFYSNVAENGVVSGRVVFEPDENIQINAYLEDEMVDTSDGLSFSQPGMYRLEIVALPARGAENLLELHKKTFTFRIFPQMISGLEIINPPVDFTIYQARRNGLDILDGTSHAVSTAGEGIYEIIFRDTKDRGVSCYLKFKKSIQLPYLEFEPFHENGSYEEAVHFQTHGEDVIVQVIRDGKEYNPVGQFLNMGGHYILRVSDSLGNYKRYELVIKYRYRLPYITGALILLGFPVLGWYLWRVRNDRNVL